LGVYTPPLHFPLGSAAEMAKQVSIRIAVGTNARFLIFGVPFRLGVNPIVRL
jgi:hypothetical protein